MPCICLLIQTYACICLHMLAYACICLHILAYAMLAYACICLAYALQMPSMSAYVCIYLLIQCIWLHIRICHAYVMHMHFILLLILCKCLLKPCIWLHMTWNNDSHLTILTVIWLRIFAYFLHMSQAAHAVMMICLHMHCIGLAYFHLHSAYIAYVFHMVCICIAYPSILHSNIWYKFWTTSSPGARIRMSIAFIAESLPLHQTQKVINLPRYENFSRAPSSWFPTWLPVFQHDCLPPLLPIFW